MPISITKTEGRTVTEYPLSPDAIPVELYFKVVHASPKAAAQWCIEAVKSLARVKLDSTDIGLQRVVVWGPPMPDSNWVSGGYVNVFVSELALRIIRALGDVRVPGAEPVSLSQLDYGLQLYKGSGADERAYKLVRSG